MTTGFVDVIAALSTELVSRWAALAKPALAQNKILVGPEFLYQEDAPPRVIAVPNTGDWRGKDVYNTTLSTIDSPSVYTWIASVDMHCWGQPDLDMSGIPIAGSDYNNTQVLFNQVALAAYNNLPGNVRLSGGRWTDTSRVIRLGREYVFTLAFDTPVVDVPFGNIPPGTTADMNDFIDQPGQPPSTIQGCKP